MKRLIIFLLLGSLFLLIRCDEPISQEKENNLEVEAEVTNTNIPDTVEKSQILLSEVLNFDIAYFENIPDETDVLSTLKTEQIKTFNKVFTSSQDDSYYIDQYLFLDSLKVEGEYDNYGWDIGMIMYASNFIADTIEISENQKLLIWGIDESTYEACPYGSWRMLYATLLDNNEPVVTFCVGEESGGGDPPAFGETRMYTTIDKSFNIDILRTNISGEEDDTVEYMDTIVNKFYYKLQKGEIISVEK